MSVPPEAMRVVRQWVERAEEDLEAAEILLAAPATLSFNAVCFHSQQCVEKYLKALLSFHSLDFPKIHDLGELLQLLPPDSRPTITPQEEERLTDYAVVTRYPGDDEPVPRERAAEALAAARMVREQSRSRLPREVLHG